MSLNPAFRQAAQEEHGDIVAADIAGEGGDLGVDGSDGFGGGNVCAGQELDQAVGSEERAVGGAGFGQAVGVEQQQVAGGEGEAALGVSDMGHRAQGQAVAAGLLLHGSGGGNGDEEGGSWPALA